jgi:tetratricopeptide (TPR) repeat protein
MTFAARTRELIAVSFLALSGGFAAGWWFARQDEGPGTGIGTGAPHAVGAAEHLELGTLSLEAGDLASAERHFREAAALDPASGRARADLGAVLMLQGRFDEAGTELDAAREAAPESPEVWFLSGMLWRDGFGDTTRAREAWERFLTLMPPDSPQAATVRGWLAELGGSPAPP